nr:reverse transcriptase domain-containing protein [Tanacetum cinerariifolium]
MINGPDQRDQLTQKNLKSGVKEQHLITIIENAVFDLVIVKLLSPFFIDEGVLEVPQVQPSVVPISIPKPDVPRTQIKPSISYPSRLNDQKLREKATNQMEKNFHIFHDLHFDISFADALLLMPKFSSTIKSLLANKDKLFELAKVPLNENCSAMLLKKLLKKLGDPGKFLIPCDFPGMKVCHALADLGASINLMPLSIWKKLSLPKLTPTQMTFELADRSITRPKGVAEDVFFKYNSKSSSPTLVSDDLISESDSSKVPIVKSSSPTLTPFGESDFFLEEVEDFLNDESIPTGIKNYVYNPEGDILFLEKLLNEDPFQLPPMDLKLTKESKEKSSIEEPPELELKELPSHLDPWVSPIHCVPKKGGMTVVANENNELIPTRLVTGWRTMTHLLEKETPFVFSKECIDAFNTLKKKLTEAPILVVPDWNLPFELMYDASDYAIGAVLGQRKLKHF